MAKTTTTAATAGDELVTMQTAAKILGGVSTRHVANTIRAGELPSVRMGARRLVRRSDLQTFIANLKG